MDYKARDPEGVARGGGALSSIMHVPTMQHLIYSTDVMQLSVRTLMLRKSLASECYSTRMLLASRLHIPNEFTCARMHNISSLLYNSPYPACG